MEGYELSAKEDNPQGSRENTWDVEIKRLPSGVQGISAYQIGNGVSTLYRSARGLFRGGYKRLSED